MSAGTHPLAGASVLICGATGGIGGALAVELDRRGAKLTLAGRDRARLEWLPVTGQHYVGDLRAPQACAELLTLAAAPTGGLDVVINATGVVAFGNVIELDPGVARVLLETNALIPMLLAREALTRLRPGGAFLNVSGIVAEQSVAGMAAYCASKAAARSFAAAMAREARRARLRVVDARPPHTETGLMTRALAGTGPQLPEGISPGHVATVICDGLESGARDLAPDAFGS